MTYQILIADDDARIRRLIRQIIAGLASVIYEAADGAEALNVCAAARPDWVLMDLRMSPVDGLHALLAMRERFPHIRVIMLSQYDEASLRAKALHLGACAYVLKENLADLTGIIQDAPAPGEPAKPAPCRSASTI